MGIRRILPLAAFAAGEVSTSAKVASLPDFFLDLTLLVAARPIQHVEGVPQVVGIGSAQLEIDIGWLIRLERIHLELEAGCQQ